MSMDEDEVVQASAPDDVTAMLALKVRGCGVKRIAGVRYLSQDGAALRSRRELGRAFPGAAPTGAG
jgi:hypothetical protein